MYGTYLQKKDSDSAYENALVQMEKAALSSREFEETKSIVSYDLQSKIAIDTKRKKICIWTNKFRDSFLYESTNYQHEYEVNCYDFDDLLAVEILTKGKSIQSTSRSSQIGGAVIGGAIAGNVGALIGASGADSTSYNIDTSTDLSITVNDLEKSHYLINFFLEYSDPEVRGTRNTIFKDPDKNIREWYGILEHIVKPSFQKESNKLTSELEEMYLLKEKGIVTEEEFQEYKKQKLSR